MASQNKITEMIAAIKTIYPYYAKDANVSILVRTWTALLKEYTDDVVESAFYLALKVCKMPPTPADIIEQIKDMQASLEPTTEELWDKYITTLEKSFRQTERFHYTFVDSTGLSQGQQARNKFDKLWEELPDKVKQYIGSKGELMRQCRLWASDRDFISFEKPRFMKAIPTIEKRMEYNALMLEGKTKLLN